MPTKMHKPEWIVTSLPTNGLTTYPHKLSVNSVWAPDQLLRSWNIARNTGKPGAEPKL